MNKQEQSEQTLKRHQKLHLIKSGTELELKLVICLVRLCKCCSNRDVAEFVLISASTFKPELELHFGLVLDYVG